MSEKPYAPPTARVLDAQSPSPPKPLSVKHAVVCLWISVAVTVASAGFHVNILTAADVVVLAVTACLLAVVAAKVAARRGWARWLFLVVWILGSLSGIVVIVLAPRAFLAWPHTVQGIAVLQFAIQTVALLLLFTRASREWFRVSHTIPGSNAGG